MIFFSIELFSQLNYWAILTAAVVAFFLGGLWYSPAMFEGPWIAANGFSDEQVKATLSSLVPFGFASAFIAYFVLSTVFALVIKALEIENVLDGIILGVLVWLGFIATLGLTTTLFSPRTMIAWGIDASFQLTILAATGAILSAWR